MVILAMAYGFEPSQIPRSNKELSVMILDRHEAMKPLYDESLPCYEISISLGICDKLNGCRLHRVVEVIGEDIHPGKGD